MPATKPFRSGTCASTLLAWITSARVAFARPARSASLGRRTRSASGSGAARAPPPRCSRPARSRAPARRPPVVLQQVAVVAGDLDDQAVAVRAAALRASAAARSRGVRDHRVGERREVDVVAEQLLGRHRLGDLHQAARGQNARVERVARLRRRRDPRPSASALASGVGPSDRTDSQTSARARTARQLRHAARAERTRDTTRWSGAALRRG